MLGGVRGQPERQWLGYLRSDTSDGRSRLVDETVAKDPGHQMARTRSNGAVCAVDEPAMRAETSNDGLLVAWPHRRSWVSAILDVPCPRLLTVLWIWRTHRWPMARLASS